MNYQINLYEGEKPYIFVSYAHKDTELVMPILEMLSRKGFRIWYDDGIVPGSEWPENIAQHLNNCQTILAFISPNSNDSVNCRRELTYAFSKNKTFLGIVLEKTKMSAGLEMQISSHQCILRYNYVNPETGEVDDIKLIEKLMKVEELYECFETDDDLIGSGCDEENKESIKWNLQKVEKLRQERLALAQEMEAIEKSINEEKQSGKKKEKKKNKDQIIAIAGILIASLIFIMILTAVIQSEVFSSEVQITNRTSLPKNHTWVTLYGEIIDNNVLLNIEKLNMVNELKFEECFFDNVDFTQLKHLSSLTDFEMIDCTGIDSFAFLEECKEGGRVVLNNCGVSDTNINIGKLTQEHIDLSGNKDISDISQINPNIKSLSISGTSVSDISVLKNCLQLSTLYISDCNQIEDFAPLYQVGLERLYAENCGIKSIEQCFLKSDMTVIDLQGNSIEDAGFLDNQTHLELINMTGNPITRLDCARESADTLTHLYVSETQLGADFLDSIAECKKLEYLYFDGIHVENLDFISEMEQLIDLSADHCGIKDVMGLKGKEHLWHIWLGNNKITTSQAFEDIEFPLGGYVDVRNNKIQDYKFPELHTLLMQGNPVSMLESMPDIADVVELVVDYNDLLLLLEKRSKAFSDTSMIFDLVVLDAPEDKKQALKTSMAADCTMCTTKRFEEYYGTERNLGYLGIWDL